MKDRLDTNQAGLEIYISRQWTIGPPALEIWWSCQMSGGPNVAARVYLQEFTPYKTFEKTVQHLNCIQKRYDIGHKKYLCTRNVVKYCFLF